MRTQTHVGKSSTASVLVFLDYRNILDKPREIKRLRFLVLIYSLVHLLMFEGEEDGRNLYRMIFK